MKYSLYVVRKGDGVTFVGRFSTIPQAKKVAVTEFLRTSHYSHAFVVGPKGVIVWNSSWVGTHKNRRKTVTSRVRVAKRKANPRGVLVYQQITRVEGTKGPGSQYAGQKFFHNFKRPYPVMLGLPDGSLLIKSKR